MLLPLRRFAARAFLVLALASMARAADEPPGAKIFLEKCALCHQPNGAGVPPVYPPLAGSDWLTGKREEVMKAVCEGLSGPIDVAGQHYDNLMPAQILDDGQVADVLSFVAASWGNKAEPFTAAQVKKARADSRFPTYAKLVESAEYKPLPAAPVGFTLREVAQAPEFLTRLASDASHQHIYATATSGNIYSVDLGVGALVSLIKVNEYLDPKRGDIAVMGIAVDAQGRLWVVSNQKLTATVPYQSEIIIWRSGEIADGQPIKLQPWFRTSYPYGIGPYNHGVSCMNFGPDGMLYVNSGSRTDGGEPGNDPNRYSGGEVDITACIWRLDPKAAEPKIEVLARGIRNAYGFAWDAAGNLFTFSNGPDVNAPEEMDFIQRGKHYGFPYQFADWPVKPGFPYPYTPKPPEGLQFELPVVNVGPAGGGSPAGLSTFDAHSSPGGAIWCGDDFPASVRGSFLLTRFGNLLGPPAAPEDVGFDLLSVRPERKADGTWIAHVNTVLAPLARPLDILSLGKGRALILEYTRPTDFKSKLGWLPGRILALEAKPE
jgi:mono/diheme cytochrome c family protein